MGIYINKGNEGFRRIRNSEYVDKSGLIAIVNKTLFTEQSFSCVTRSRRFGKTMAAKMLCAYYDKSCDSRSLFADLEIASHPSFEQHLNKYPVISIDTKKKENVGNFKNPGSEYRKEKSPRKVLDHDFPIPELGKVNPYGVYVLNDNTGFVNLGTSHDTAEFAGESVYQWWEAVGKNTFPEAKRLYINCDGGGSNSSRRWIWKYQLQLLANKTGLEIEVSHFPPGTSKWNKVEHRLFCYISKNWQGQPLIDIETIVSLIGSTTTKKGLKVICQVDNNVYETGKKISEEEKESINIEFLEPFTQWNYIIRPIQNDVVVS